MSSLIKPNNRYSWTVPHVGHGGLGSLGAVDLAANGPADNTHDFKSPLLRFHRPVATFVNLSTLAESTSQLPVSASDASHQSIEKTPLSMDSSSLPVPLSSLPVQKPSHQSVITSQSEQKTLFPMSSSPLSVSSSLPVRWPLPVEFLASARLHDLGPSDIRDVCRCVSGEERRFRPEGLVALPGGSVAVSDGLSNKVMVFSGDGRRVGYIGHRGRGTLGKPRSIAAMPNGTVAVLDASDGSVKVYSCTGDYMYTIKDWFTDRVVPLAATPEGDLILAHGQTLVVTSLTLHGPSRTSCTNVTSARDLSTARGLAASRDHVVLCGMEEDDVMLINRKSGQVEKTFTFSENVQNWNVGLRSSFFGACFDSKNNCYLADADNNGILMIDSQGEKVVNFHCDSWIRRATRSRAFSQLDSVLLCPKFVCMTYNGELLLVEHLGKVKKLLIPKGDFIV